ncbi:unnamed protein product, partial [Prorocentrum cordatum]
TTCVRTWYLRHLGFEVDQLYRYLVDTVLDADGERAAVCSPKLLSDDYPRAVLRTIWPQGVIPDDALPGWPRWTFDAERCFLAHVVAVAGRPRRHEGQLGARYPPLAHRQQLLAYVVHLGQQAVGACPCLAREAVAPGLRPVPSRFHEPVAKQAAAGPEDARARVQSLKLPAVGPPNGPELTDRPIAGLASDRDIVAPGCLQREVMRHCVALASQHRRQCVDHLGRAEGLRDGALAGQWGDDRAALVHLVSFLTMGAVNGGGDLGARWEQRVRANRMRFGPSPLADPRAVLGAFVAAAD